jgi:hypothetical protein
MPARTRAAARAFLSKGAETANVTSNMSDHTDRQFRHVPDPGDSIVPELPQVGALRGPSEVTDKATWRKAQKGFSSVVRLHIE